MTVNLSALAGAGAQFFDNNGNILSGGKLYSYAAGTTTPQTTYTSASGSTAHTNPIILNSAGRVATGEIWLTEDVAYKFSLYTSVNVLIATYDDIPSINDLTGVNALANNLANTSDPTLGDALVGFRQSNSNGNLAGSVGRTVHQKLQESISVLDFGAVGDGTTNDAAAIQAALDALEAANGGTLLVPWPAVIYNLGSTGIDVPSSVNVMCEGSPGIIAGLQQFLYSGSNAAFRMKDGEGVASGTFRSIRLDNVGVRLTTAGSTGIRLRHGRDALVVMCAVRMEANNQIGFHLQGEADGSANRGVFDVTLQRTMSYTSSAAFTGAVHYKLSGASNNGQCNANLFLNIRGGGSGKGVEIGPSNTNSFLMPEFEAITGDCFDIQADAFENGIHDVYVEAQAGWTGVIMRTAAGSFRNYLNSYVAGANVDPNDLAITVGNFVRWNALARVYVGVETNSVLTARTSTSADDYFTLRPDGLRFGDGSADPVKAFNARQMTVARTNFSSGASNSVTPDVSVALIQFVRTLAGSSGTLTINEPINAISDGDTLQFNIFNDSGGTITLAWNATFVRNANFPTSLTDGQRLTLMCTNMASAWYLIGTPITMG